MSKFNLDTDFCRQCGCDSGWCDGCVKKKYYQQGRAEAIDEMKALIYQFDNYCNERECKYCWMNVSDDYSCLKQWINSKFEELKEQK